MERLTRFPWGTLCLSAIFNGAAAIAIFGFGAPPWILLPVTLSGATLYMTMASHVDRRLDRH